MRAEVLAPAGGEEQLLAAVRAGADAVYLGTKSFNARSGAQNFDVEGLKEAVRYCHARGVKVHVTLNTLVRDEEILKVGQELQHVAQSGADAVIVQDLAVAALVKKHCPSLCMHASTQMTIHNLEGVRIAKELGFSRVVLARELSLREISAIAEGSDLELEVFIHGALCMCLSGACYLSAMIGGRSGNRGRCAQPCRLDFKSEGRAYALSLKDMSHIAHIQALSEAGICSFKIEGRMKRPEYVASAVCAVREALEGREPDMERLQAVFSRSGFTDGYLTGRRAHMFGVRTKVDVAASLKAMPAEVARYRMERQSVPLSMTLTLCAGEPAVLQISDASHTVLVKGPRAETAKTAALDAQRAKTNLAKLGGTPFYLDVFAAQIEPQTTLPAAALNALRREAVQTLLEKRAQATPHAWIAAEDALPPPAGAESEKRELRVRALRYEQLYPGIEADAFILPLKEIIAHPQAADRFEDRLVCELPQVVFPDDAGKLPKQLLEVAQMGVCTAIAENLGAIAMAKDAGFAVKGGHGLNVLNSLSAAMLAELGIEDITLSFELQAAKLPDLRVKGKKGILGYGRLPLMLMRACPRREKVRCVDCPGYGELTDRKRQKFSLLCMERKYTVLLNSLPLYVADKPICGIDFTTAYFTVESPEEVKRTLAAYQNAKPYGGTRTRGLYFRTLD